jgi:hypothetical protein
VAALLQLAACASEAQGANPDPPPGSQTEADVQQLEALVDALATLPLEGPSRGGPYVGLAANDTTRAVVAAGPAVVPVLVKALDTAGDAQAAWIVFCLRELHARGAKPAVQRLATALQPGGRLAGTPRTLTVDMQVRFYLRDVETWPVR